MIDMIKINLVKLASYYEKTLTPEQIAIYSEQLSESLTDAEASLACKLYINDPNNEFFPRPVSKLIYLVKKPVSSEDMAQNITSLLMEAERKYGVHWAEGFFQDGEKIYQGKDICYKNWADAALSVFGEVGLTAVNRYGGWVNLCQTIYDSPDGVVRAQFRGLTTSLQNIKEKTGSYDSLPSIGRRDPDLQISDSRNEQVGRLLELFNKDKK